MKQKFLFLAAALTLLGAPLTSCDKDDEPTQTAQSVSVANTMWRAGNGTTIKFYTDGTCQLGQGSSASVYHQSGNEIDFDGYLIWYGSELYHVDNGYVNGNTMTVNMFSASKPALSAKFYKVK